MKIAKQVSGLLPRRIYCSTTAHRRLSRDGRPTGFVVTGIILNRGLAPGNGYCLNSVLAQPSPVAPFCILGLVFCPTDNRLDLVIRFPVHSPLFTFRE
jgi:hypothetical protein